MSTWPVPGSGSGWSRYSISPSMIVAAFMRTSWLRLARYAHSDAVGTAVPTAWCFGFGSSSSQLGRLGVQRLWLAESQRHVIRGRRHNPDSEAEEHVGAAGCREGPRRSGGISALVHVRSSVRGLRPEADWLHGHPRWRSS